MTRQIIDALSRQFHGAILGGANIHIFVFKGHKNNGFQKKLARQNTIYEYSPLQLSTLATPLVTNV